MATSIFIIDGHSYIEERWGDYVPPKIEYRLVNAQIAEVHFGEGTLPVSRLSGT